MLRVLRLKAGLDQAAVAKLLQISQPTVSRWEAGSSLPSVEQAQVLVDACLSTMRGPAQKAAQAAKAALTAALSLAGGTLTDTVKQRIEQSLTALLGVGPEVYEAQVPYFADVAAGLGETQEQRVAPRSQLAVPRRIYEQDPGAYAMRVVGDSMAPQLQAGDIVVVSPAAPLLDGCIVAAYVEPDGDVVKIYRELENGQILLQPANPAYPSILLGAHQEREARVWGRVVLCLREL